MTEWREEEHPRDPDGKFAEKDNRTAGKEIGKKFLEEAERIARADGEWKDLDWKPIKKKPPEEEKIPAGEKLGGRTQYKSSIAGVKQGKPMSFKEADGGRCNPNYGTYGGYNDNCQTCVPVFLARLHGFDVKALPMNENTEHTRWLASHALEIFVDDKGNHPKAIVPAEGQDIKSFFEEQVKPGRLYALAYYYNNKKWGHITTVDYLGNEFRAYDPQSGDEKSMDGMVAFLKRTDTTKHKLYDITDFRVDEEISSFVMEDSKCR